MLANKNATEKGRIFRIEKLSDYVLQSYGARGRLREARKIDRDVTVWRKLLNAADAEF